jgi:hypothetical protein
MPPYDRGKHGIRLSIGVRQAEGSSLPGRAGRVGSGHAGHRRGGSARVDHGGALEGYVSNYSLAVHYQQAAVKKATIKSRFGDPQSNPAAAAPRAHWALAKAFAAEVGLTPSARTRIEMPTKTTEFDEFLFGPVRAVDAPEGEGGSRARARPSQGGGGCGAHGERAGRAGIPTRRSRLGTDNPIRRDSESPSRPTASSVAACSAAPDRSP